MNLNMLQRTNLKTVLDKTKACDLSYEEQQKVLINLYSSFEIKLINAFSIDLLDPKKI